MTAGSFAFYKLPDSDEYVSVRSSKVRQLSDDPALMPVEPGFMAYPFHSSDTCHPFLIPADDTIVRKIPDDIQCEGYGKTDGTIMTDQDYPLYSKEFSLFHNAVCSGSFRKLVLARNRAVHPETAVDCTALFLRACRKYPHAMVMMFRGIQTGVWLCATPEPLLRCSGGMFRTVALAGTMAYDGKSVPSVEDWSAKNREEQQVVCNFIVDATAPYASDLQIDGPYTVRAGNLLHLRTDISFRASGDNFGRIAAALHPTPAVCGFPQESAKTFIRENERQSRGYYSGFAGPVAMGGRTDLFVNLRSACISDDGMTASLYAGGGIMKDSSCRSEYEETIHKMQTIAGIF